MKSTEPAVRTPRPPKEVRDEIRRSQIVEAARHCVIRRGFHAAPMSEIARQAQMSVGQIYRYFANKDAIIRAIVEDIIERRLNYIMNSAAPYTARRLATRAVELDARHEQDATLMLEVTAEATRDPEIAAVVEDADRRSQQHLLRKLMQQHPGLGRAEAAARAEVLAVLIEGTMFRRMTKLQAGPEALTALYASLLEVLTRD